MKTTSLLALFASVSLFACSAVDNGPIKQDGTGVGEPGTDQPADDGNQGDGTSSGTTSGSTGGSTGSDAGGGGTTVNGGGSAAPTWTTIYNSYFAKGTVGRCGDSGCHAYSRGGFKCGTTSSTCFDGMVAAGMISKTNPKASVLVDPNQSPLTWFGGNMPSSRTPQNAQAKADLQAWVAAGAQKN